MGDSAFFGKIARSVHLGEVGIMRESARILLVAVLVLSYSVSAYAQEALLNELYSRFGVLYQQGRYGEAAKVAEEALTVAEKMFGPNHPNTAAFLNNLALVYHKQGRYTESGQLLEKTLELRERVLGREHPDTLKTMNSLAIAYHHLKRYEEAERVYRQTLPIRFSIRLCYIKIAPGVLQWSSAILMMTVYST